MSTKRGEDQSEKSTAEESSRFAAEMDAHKAKLSKPFIPIIRNLHIFSDTFPEGKLPPYFDGNALQIERDLPLTPAQRSQREPYLTGKIISKLTGQYAYAPSTRDLWKESGLNDDDFRPVATDHKLSHGLQDLGEKLENLKLKISTDSQRNRLDWMDRAREVREHARKVQDHLQPGGHRAVAHFQAGVIAILDQAIDDPVKAELHGTAVGFAAYFVSRLKIYLEFLDYEKSLIDHLTAAEKVLFKWQTDHANPNRDQIELLKELLSSDDRSLNHESRCKKWISDDGAELFREILDDKPAFLAERENARRRAVDDFENAFLRTSAKSSTQDLERAQLPVSHESLLQQQRVKNKLGRPAIARKDVNDFLENIRELKSPKIGARDPTLDEWAFFISAELKNKGRERTPGAVRKQLAASWTFERIEGRIVDDRRVYKPQKK